MATKKKATLLAMGKERRLGDTGRPLRVRPYGPVSDGQANFQCAVQGTGRERRVAARPAPGGNRSRSSQALRCDRGRTGLAAHASSECYGTSESHYRRSCRGVPRGQPAAGSHRADHSGSGVQAQCSHRPDDRIRPGLEVASRAQPEGDGQGIDDDPLDARTRGSPRHPCRDAKARLEAGVAGPEHRSSGWSGDRSLNGSAWSGDSVRRSAPASGDSSGEPWPCCPM